MLSTIKSAISILTILPALLALIPRITELVHQVETLGVAGLTKKELVLTLLHDSIELAATSFSLKLPTDLIVKWADGIIDVIVMVENTLGKLLPHASGDTPVPTSLMPDSPTK